MTTSTPTAEIRAELPADARMDAYYYSFDRTGVGLVDAVLSAVAVAGKGSHHTSGWADHSDDSSYYYKERPGLPDADCGTDLIQLTAERSAALVLALCDRLEAAEAKLAAVRELHSGIVVSGPQCCNECDGISYPCPTLRALDGEQP